MEGDKEFDDTLPDPIVNNSEQEGDDWVGETPEYSPKSEFSKAKIVADAVARCIEARGKEMKQGYWNTTLTKDGFPIKTWVPDTRKVYIGTVEALYNLMSPEVKRAKNFSGIDSKKKELFDKYCYKERSKVMEKGRVVWKENEKELIPEIDAEVIMQNIRNPNSAVIARGAWNLYVNAYWDEMLVLYDSLFGELNDLIDILNYFKMALSY